MTYSPNPLTHLPLSDRGALWCPACASYCEESAPCACDTPPAEPALLLDDGMTEDELREAAGIQREMQHEPIAGKPDLPRSRTRRQGDGVHMISDGDSGVAGDSHG